MSNSRGEPALQPEEAALVQRCKQGQTGAFDELVLTHQRQVFAVALRLLGNADEAREIAQDTFIRAYRAIGAFRHEAKVSTWLITITTNLCRNRRRWWARRRRVIVASLDEPFEGAEGGQGRDVADPSPSPATAAERGERQQFLLQALQGLSQVERTVVVLRDLQGHSYEEIAQMMRCQVGTVKSRLSRARLQLKALLDGRCS